MIASFTLSWIWCIFSENVTTADENGERIPSSEHIDKDVEQRLKEHPGFKNKDSSSFQCVADILVSNPGVKKVQISSASSEKTGN